MCFTGSSAASEIGDKVEQVKLEIRLSLGYLEPQMKIGQFELKNLCRLAPMAGISNIPFRLLCKELGSSLTTSEEISCNGLVYGHERTLDLAGYLPAEKPIAMQLVGSDEDALVKAAQILVDQGADIIDLNMGCPVPKIIKTGAGSALMRDTEKCARLFKKMRQAIPVPFTIKIRGGWDAHNVNAPEIAAIAEAEGVDSICVHPRTRSQMFSGLAPWEIIRRVVETVKIPVTGNGDVKSYDDALEMQRLTGCQSVMIGRGALGRPWVFDREFASLSSEVQHEYKRKIILRHFDLIETHMREGFALIQMKKHLAWYTTGMAGAAKARQTIFTFASVSELRNFFTDYWASSSFVSGPESDSLNAVDLASKTIASDLPAAP